MKEATIRETNTTPPVKTEKKEVEMMTIKVDPEMTDGGITINGKLYVGTITVPREQAEDMLRIQDEYFETKRKLMDPQVTVRMKSDFQKEKLFLADPAVHGGRQGFTRDYGLLGAREWGFCSEVFKKHLLGERKARYGY